MTVQHNGDGRNPGLSTFVVDTVDKLTGAHDELARMRLYVERLKAQLGDRDREIARLRGQLAMERLTDEQKALQRAYDAILWMIDELVIRQGKDITQKRARELGVDTRTYAYASAYLRAIGYTEEGTYSKRLRGGWRESLDRIHKSAMADPVYVRKLYPAWLRAEILARQAAGTN